jgi:hypothetical protein
MLRKLSLAARSRSIINRDVMDGPGADWPLWASGNAETDIGIDPVERQLSTHTGLSCIGWAATDLGRKQTSRRGATSYRYWIALRPTISVVGSGWGVHGRYLERTMLWRRTADASVGRPWLRRLGRASSRAIAARSAKCIIVMGWRMIGGTKWRLLEGIRSE